jgi:transposase
MRPTYNDLLKEIADLKAQLAVEKQRNTKLEARIAELESRLNKNSRNSSRPPSSDPLWECRKPPAPPSSRKPGGQPGHPGHHRPLLPAGQMDQHIPVKPKSCGGCGHRLRGCDANPIRHQVAELPKIRLHWTEYRMHALVCPKCGKTTRAELPKGVPTCGYGPGLQTLIANASGVYRLSKRTIVGLMGDWFDLPLSAGSVVACEQHISEALAGPMEEARAYVERQSDANMDETGWRQRRSKAWMWVMVTLWVTVFMIHQRRNTDAALALLRGFGGILTTDRWKAYLAWPLRKRQLCWAHLLRLFTAFSELGGSAGCLGERLLADSFQMFEWWHRVKDGTLARSTFRNYMKDLKHSVKMLLEEGARCRSPEVSSKCRDILKLFPAMWTFVRVEGIEPTNNAAERAIRHAVIWRKICFGTHSEEGSRFVERILTVHATLKQQGRNVVDFITQASEAHLHGRKAPSLLPSRALLRSVG